MRELAALNRTHIPHTGDLYASAVGTTVRQLKEIPPRPAEFDGALCVFLLRDKDWKVQDVDEATLRAAFGKYGEITRCELTGELRDNQGGVLVWFATHEAALAARRAGPIEGVCSGVDTLYNERSYDGRKGEEGRDDDDGRGWCASCEMFCEECDGAYMCASVSAVWPYRTRGAPQCSLAA